MPRKPEILNCQEVARSRLFRVESVDLRFSNGEERVYERLAARGSAAVLIVPMLDDKTVLLIREYGVGVEDYELGLPKGRVEVGEDPLEAANRELMEEVGYGAKSLTKLKLLSQSPNYMQHHTQVVLAQGLYPQTAEGDEPEPLIVEQYPLADLDQLVLRDDFTEARSLAALFLARAHLSR
ncbi:ADP compounds hydrolase NudE [Teredinibacter turnerae]|uniref:ADP compounds hydrolase NudE n=1 Tax=Teredinibacter turnerae TaxID=2426 RepID=UPI00037D8C1B|nr:ADP compounds hydrolase NudE [Teredinibacter turnerae]